MKLLLADDHVLFRDALIQFIIGLRPDWTIETVADFHEVETCLESGQKFDLVLLDLRMPGMDGMNGLRIIRENYPNQMTSILSGIAEEHHIREAITLGARAYMPKTLSGHALVQAIELVVYAKHKFIPMDDTGTKLMPSYYDGHSEYNPTDTSESDLKNQVMNSLTKREKEVLHYLSQGLSNKEIAIEMDIQLATVKLHVGSVCKKLGVSNRTQAAIMAHNNGLSTIAHL